MSNIALNGPVGRALRATISIDDHDDEHWQAGREPDGAEEGGHARGGAAVEAAESQAEGAEPESGDG